MSYWPKHKKPEGYSYDYDDDEATCGKAHCTIEIQHLSEPAMVASWERETAKPFDDLKHNCCTVTAVILREGYNASFTSEGFWTSTGRFIKRGFRVATSPYKSFTTMAKNELREVLVWSPARIEDYAKWLQQNTA